MLLAESPRPLRRVIEAYREVGLGEVLADYMGEWPALSVKKSTLRKASPDSARGWHQDGRFLGERVHTVNVWTALTPCGIHAPSVDVFSMPFDHIVETGTEGADHPWSVSRDEAAKYGTDAIVRPVFAPGDALMFNQLTLHESGIGPGDDRGSLRHRVVVLRPVELPDRAGADRLLTPARSTARPGAEQVGPAGLRACWWR